MQILTSIDMNKNELQNVVVQNLAGPPSNPRTGQIYFNTSDKLQYQYNGTEWVPVGKPYKLPAATRDTLGGVKEGVGILIDEDGTINLNANAADVNALSADGGTMKGAIDMGSQKIKNLPKAVDNGDAVNKEQMDNAIAGIGTVFNLKGSKPNYDALPKVGNSIGDVWYVDNEEVGYIWIEKDGVPQWEKFGAPIDLSGYLTKADLLQDTGTETNNTMSQKAITDKLNLKVDKTELENTNKEVALKANKTALDETNKEVALKENKTTVTEKLSKKADKVTVEAIPVVKIVTGTIGTSASSVAVSYTGKIVNSFAKNSNGEIVIVNIDISESSVTFSTIGNPATPLTCSVVYI